LGAPWEGGGQMFDKGKKREDGRPIKSKRTENVCFLLFCPSFSLCKFADIKKEKLPLQGKFLVKWQTILFS
jgi:hypothetical protein